ncbi:MAG: DUF6472 family protein [Acutalibacteraceae bacterium]|nr:DUF6472 family protein [Acutalibacteraceae bacterium]
MKSDTLCEKCAYFDYDDEVGDYVCGAYLDEDELYRYMSSGKKCPYFRPYDEYKIVQRQN